MAEGILELTSSKWDSEVLNSKGITIVDFWALCAPCRIIAPTISLFKSMREKLKLPNLIQMRIL